MKSQREPNAGKEAMKGLGKIYTVKIFSSWEMFAFDVAIWDVSEFIQGGT